MVCIKQVFCFNSVCINKVPLYNPSSLEQGEEAKVRTVAQMFRKFCYDYRDRLTAGIICAGWDRHEGGQVFSIPLGGMCIRQPFAIGGVYIYCILGMRMHMQCFTPPASTACERAHFLGVYT